MAAEVAETPRWAGPRWRVADFTELIENGRNDHERYRFLISALPRRFHSTSRERQGLALRQAPRLTGTKWDALLAAVAEHMALTHDHPVPAWCDEPERFLRIPWMPIPAYGPRFPGMIWRDAPGAFLRHGLLVSSRELGPREGHRFYGSLLGR